MMIEKLLLVLNANEDAFDRKIQNMQNGAPKWRHLITPPRS